jgi:hypothetical protein
MMTVTQMAEAAHEMNRLWCIALGDHSQPPWSDAPDWQKESAISGVQGIASGRITKPSDSHDSWMAQKIAEGWSYGRVKDPVAKTHPCMVPYEDLFGEQRAKDTIFFNTVRTLITANGMAGHT